MKDWVKREEFGQRLEPAGVVLHGAGQSSAALREYTEALGPGLSPAVYMTYCGLRGFKRGDLLKRLAKNEVVLGAGMPVPQIGLALTYDGSPEWCYDEEVAAGKHDAALDAFCADLQEYGRPVFLRIGYEFNGSWNGYRPEPFKAAWRHICRKLSEHRLDQVARVWCYAPDEADNVWAPYYPGDELVDWWGIDLFSSGHMTQPDTAAFLEEAAAHGRPVMIGESTPRYCGVQDGEKSWQTWFEPYFDLIHSHGQIKAFCYINWDWSEYPKWHDWGDGRIQQNREVLEHYRRELASSYYRHITAGG